jgi:hypothetical protein
MAGAVDTPLVGLPLIRRMARVDSRRALELLAARLARLEEREETEGLDLDGVEELGQIIALSTDIAEEVDDRDRLLPRRQGRRPWVRGGH